MEIWNPISMHGSKRNFTYSRWKTKRNSWKSVFQCPLLQEQNAGSRIMDRKAFKTNWWYSQVAIYYEQTLETHYPFGLFAVPMSWDVVSMLRRYYRKTKNSGYTRNDISTGRKLWRRTLTSGGAKKMISYKVAMVWTLYRVWVFITEWKR